MESEGTGSGTGTGAGTSTVPNAALPPERWHIFCRVIDNYGDVGVCWRLAADLADRGALVRLFIDDAQALRWMAPAGHAQVQVLRWLADEAEPLPTDTADVVIEAFGCNPPAAYVRAMALRQPVPPVWINLEYLSAENYVERSHGLPSPQPGGLVKWFYFPGFTSHTGGLLRERDLHTRQAAFDRPQWLHRHGIALQPGVRLVSLFCYPNAGLPALLQALAVQPTHVLLTPGPAQAAAAHAPPGLRVQALPWLTQQAYDQLLWACDLNLVRGEDSLVRALWAGQAFVWQAYPQQDGAHHGKVQALLSRWQPSANVAALWHWWNAPPAVQASRPLPALPDLQPWQKSVTPWRQLLQQQAPLGEQLLAFAHSKRGATPGAAGN